MRSSDVVALGAGFAVVVFIGIIPGMADTFIAVTKASPYLTSFLKFAILATFGECLGLRIISGAYNRPGFGILPRAFVWGVLGMGIKAAFTVFSNGAPALLVELGLPFSAFSLEEGSFAIRLAAAFTISASMNLVWAPVLMTLHKITDCHIEATGGTFAGLFSIIPVARILRELNWDVMWNFVFKKTIPFFWIPAHTVTFLLPPYLQILAAAILGVVLGVILAFASAATPRR